MSTDTLTQGGKIEGMSRRDCDNCITQHEQSFQMVLMWRGHCRVPLHHAAIRQLPSIDAAMRHLPDKHASFTMHCPSARSIVDSGTESLNIAYVRCEIHLVTS